MNVYLSYYCFRFETQSVLRPDIFIATATRRFSTAALGKAASRPHDALAISVHLFTAALIGQIVPGLLSTRSCACDQRVRWVRHLDFFRSTAAPIGQTMSGELSTRRTGCCGCELRMRSAPRAIGPRS